jgi:deoxyribonuclease-2
MIGFVALIGVQLLAVNALSCLDEDGKAVDYWVALKHPNGGEYDYFDEFSSAFKKGDGDLTTKNTGSIGNTFGQVYDNPDEIAYIMYNDEDPQSKSHASRAHSKGVAAFDSKQGFWVVHSIPRFPPNTTVGWSDGGLESDKFGQSFLCVTYDLDQMDKVAAQLRIIYPAQYDWNMPKSLEDSVPEFTNLVDDKADKTKETSIVDLKSAGGTTFTSFAKSKDWGKNLYADLVAPELKSDLYVETWQNGATSNVIPTFCPSKGYKIYNVMDVASTDEAWKSTQDHSKWCVTVDEGSACIGGINRQFSQETRGGGTVCLENKKLWSGMSDFVKDYEDCPAKEELFDLLEDA